MQKITKLQKCTSRSDLARVLNFTPKGVSYLLYFFPAEKKYHTFEIPKKSGGTRIITAPTPKIKLLQKRLSNLLQDCQEDIPSLQSRHRSISHGFRRKHSIFTNANRHKNKNYVFNIDLKDFFDSFNFGRVRGFFIKDKNFNLTPEVATTIAQIACHENKLPQGSPCSPVITNLILHILDIRLSKLASKFKCTYTRYADDITFSTNEKYFPEEIAAPSQDIFDQWLPGKTLHKEIKKSGFEINPKKTRMQYPGSRIEITGLSANKKVNTKKEYRLKTRAMVDRLLKEKPVIIDQEYDPKDKEQLDIILRKLSGRLSHIHHIDRMRFNTKESSHDKYIINPHNTPLSGREKTYRDFFFYSRFMKAEKPLIICEGETDAIYLKCAIKNIQPQNTNLISQDGARNIDFLNFSNTTANLLRLGGGSDHLKKFIPYYTKFVSESASSGLVQPVIILVDNDSGSKEIFSVCKGFLNEHIDGSKPFYRIKYNLYLVALPKINNKPTSIEDLFTKETITKVVKGKTFHPNEKADKEKHFGKKQFAEKVVVKEQEKINFEGFRETLERIGMAIDDYKKYGENE